MTTPHADIEQVLFSEDVIAQRVRELAEQINKDYEGKSLVIIGILKGAFIYMADLGKSVCQPKKKKKNPFLSFT